MPPRDPLKQIIDWCKNAKSLNEFLEKVPHFRAGFEASNMLSKERMFRYIRSQIEPELDLIKIGMKGADNNVDWYSPAKYTSLLAVLNWYAAEKGISSIKSFTLTCSGKTLFFSEHTRSLLDLGIKD